jgi:hypothetical protein
MLSSEAVVIRQGTMKRCRPPRWCRVILLIRAGDRILPCGLLKQSAGGKAILYRRVDGRGKKHRKLTAIFLSAIARTCCFSGTTVSSGGGKGLVVATGGDTELGHINQMMADIEKHRTPLLVQMDKLGKAIFIIILVMMAALFVFSLLFRDMPVSELMLSLISPAGGLGAGRFAGDHLDILFGRADHGAAEGDYPQAADG